MTNREATGRQLGRTLRATLRASLEAWGNWVKANHHNNSPMSQAAEAEHLDTAAARLERAVHTSLGSTVQWRPEDLDRCEHGRHSIDDCSGCPGGKSTGNLFLLRDPLEVDRLTTRVEDGALMVRIGTTYAGVPIVVEAWRPPQGTQ